FGGPIPLPGNYNRNRDKLFFFYTHERWLIRVPKAIQRHNMPTALERQGDFSQSLDTNGELIVIRDPLTGEPFPGNVIPPDRIHPFGPRLLSVLPEPNFFDRSISGGAYNYIFQDSGDNPKRYHSLR